jgi:ketosteroid isomerase-like protein
MKKYPVLFAVAGMLICSSTFSQKGIKGLIDAEKAFASYTSSHTIRDGFLKYMDSDGIIFREGNAVNAIDAYRKQKAGPPILNWEPVFAIISSSGDFGITTGPFTLHPEPPGETPVFYGSFSSVWQINKQGEWKNIIDLGTSYRKPSTDAKQVQEIVLAPRGLMTAVSFDEVLALDKKLNQDLKEKNGGTVSTQLSADSWLNLEGETPVTGVRLISNVLMHIPDTVLFHSQSGQIASSGDLAYVYGTVTNGNKKQNYLRIWANRNKRWQVILQTIKW